MSEERTLPRIPLHDHLRALADRHQLPAVVVSTMREAAAEIEGGLEAFGVVVDQKREIEAQLKHSQQNHRHTLDMIAQWGDLLRELKQAHPLMLYGEEWITRIRRALCEIA